MNYRKTALVGGIAFVIIAGLANIAHASNVASALVGRWILNENSGTTANDSSGYGNSGTVVGPAQFSFDWVRGQVLSLTGLSGDVNIPYSQNLEPSSGAVTAWVMPTSAGFEGDIVSHLTNAQLRCGNYSVNLYAYALRVSSTGQPFAAFISDDPKNCSQSQYLLSGFANQVSPNQWTFLAATWDGAGTLSLYVNGQLVDQSSYRPNSTFGLSYNGNNPLLVGTDTSSTKQNPVSVSDVRVYSGALSANDILNIYNGQ